MHQQPSQSDSFLLGLCCVLGLSIMVVAVWLAMRHPGSHRTERAPSSVRIEDYSLSNFDDEKASGTTNQVVHPILGRRDAVTVPVTDLMDIGDWIMPYPVGRPLQTDAADAAAIDSPVQTSNEDLERWRQKR